MFYVILFLFKVSDESVAMTYRYKIGKIKEIFFSYFLFEFNFTVYLEFTSGLFFTKKDNYFLVFYVNVCVLGKYYLN